MSSKESLVRARYAVSVLKVARKIPPAEAIKLVDGLSKDWLDMESDEKLAEARANATLACEELAIALRGDSPGLQAHWDRAASAASLWLSLVER